MALAKHDGIDNQSQTVLWMLKEVRIMSVETALFCSRWPPFKVDQGHFDKKKISKISNNPIDHHHQQGRAAARAAAEGDGGRGGGRQGGESQGEDDDFGFGEDDESMMIMKMVVPVVWVALAVKS